MKRKLLTSLLWISLLSALCLTTLRVVAAAVADAVTNLPPVADALASPIDVVTLLLPILLPWITGLVQRLFPKAPPYIIVSIAPVLGAAWGAFNDSITAPCATRWST